MDSATAARIEEEWTRRDVEGGGVGLAKLADADFSGAVSAGGGWLYLLNGRVVGTVGGSLSGLAEAESQVAYETPHPSLPLLFAMQAHDPDPEARYFTDDAPLEEVHETLSSGSFTGYIELSENVHSGDYYTVYYGGRALHAAFVGSAERLHTAQEAYDRATDEVGIFEVFPVDLEVREVPDPREESTGAAAAGASSETAGSTPEPEADHDSETPDAEGAARSDAGAGEDTGPAPAPGSTATQGESTPDRDAASGGSEPASVPEAESGSGRPEAAEPRSADAESEPTDTESAPTPQDTGEPDRHDSPTQPEETTPEGVSESRESPRAGSDLEAQPPTDPSETQTGSDTAAERSEHADVDGPGRQDEETAQPQSGSADSVDRNAGQAGATPQGDRVEDEAAWRERQTVPALDPTNSGVESSETTTSAPAERRSTASEAGGQTQPASGQDTSEPASDRIATLEAELEELREQLSALDAERTELREERDELADERDRLRARVEELEETTASAEGSATGTDRAAGDVLPKTDLFVRYGSKSDTTLADVREGEASRESLGANIRLENHTRFDAEGVTVESEPFEAFLRGYLGYRFATWVIEEFVFEIKETGNEAVLPDLFDALPAIDRIDFDGTVTSRDEDGNETELAFDIVFRDQMGQPILVADLDEGRDPTTGDRIDGLLERSTELVERQESLAGAFLVTASFFENDVHESVKDATKTGFLDRDSRRSFVKASRNDGYHVCLVEARDDAFHLSRPDL